jgi:hypothetical protein
MHVECLTSPFVVQQDGRRTSWGRELGPVLLSERRSKHYADASVQRARER